MTPVSRVSSAGIAICAVLAGLLGGFAARLAGAGELATTRIADRVPMYVGDYPDQQVIGTWLQKADQVGDRQYPVIVVVPAAVVADPPPGLDRWPEPGEVFVSPALLAAAPEVRTRFGELAGTIGAAGLTDPGEWLVYLRPPAGLEPTGPRVAEIVGFGGPSDGSDLFSVSVGEYQPPGYVPLLPVGFGLPPVLALAAWCAVRVASTKRWRAASRSRRLRMMPLAVLVPALLGGTAAVVVGWLLGRRKIMLPLVDRGLFATGWDLPTAAAATAAVALVAAVAAGVAVLVPRWPAKRVGQPTGGGSRPGGARANRLVVTGSRWAAGALVTVLIVQQLMAMASAGTGAGQRTLAVFDVLAWAVLALSVLAVPRAFSLVMDRPWQRLPRWARPTVQPERPGSGPPRLRDVLVAAHLGLAMVVVAPWLVLGEQTEVLAGRVAAQRVGTDPGVLSVRPNVAVTAEQVAEFRALLPAGVAVVTASQDDDGRHLLEGDCASLAQLAPLREGCPAEATDAARVFADGGLAELVGNAFFADSPLVVRAAERPQPATTLLVLGKQSTWEAVGAAAFRSLPQPMVERVGEMWLVTGWPRQLPLRWAYLFVGVGFVLGLLALSVVQGTRLVDAARVARRRVGVGTAALAVGLPVGTTGLASLALLGLAEWNRCDLVPADGLPGSVLPAGLGVMVAIVVLATVWPPLATRR